MIKSIFGVFLLEMERKIAALKMILGMLVQVRPVIWVASMRKSLKLLQVKNAIG